MAEHKEAAKFVPGAASTNDATGVDYHGHPDQVLFSGKSKGVNLPVCEHYAGKERTIEKSLALQQKMGQVFDITIDLEDGAATGHEKKQAQMAVAFLNASENEFNRVGVRIHDSGSEHWKDDVDTIIGGAGDRVAYLVVPKVESVLQLESVLEYIELSGSRHHYLRRIPVHVMIETKTIMQELEDLTRLRMVESLDFGIMDFISDYQGAIAPDAVRSPLQFEHPLLRKAREEISIAAHARGLTPTNNVTVDLSDPENAYRDALRARQEFGYLRMWSIHPDQIEPIIRGMSPDHSQIQKAMAILLKAQKASWGPVEYEGLLYDRASYRIYWILLKQALLAGREIPREACRWFGEECYGTEAANDVDAS